jgi:hypothetical protein
VIFTAGTFGRGNLVFRTPRKQPRLHIFVFDVVPGRDFAVCASCFSQQTFPVGNKESTASEIRRSELRPYDFASFAKLFLVAGLSRTLVFELGLGISAVYNKQKTIDGMT